MMIFGIGTFTGSFLSLMLGETLNRPLSETLEDDIPDQDFGDYLHSYKRLRNGSPRTPHEDDVEENVFALVDSDVENDFPSEDRRTLF